MQTETNPNELKKQVSHNTETSSLKNVSETSAIQHCPKHLKDFVLYRENLKIKAGDVDGHFHAVLVGCPQPHCIRVLLRSSRLCYCEQIPHTLDELKALVKETRSK